MGSLLEPPGKTYSVFYGEFVAFLGGRGSREVTWNISRNNDEE